MSNNQSKRASALLPIAAGLVGFIIVATLLVPIAANQWNSWMHKRETRAWVALHVEQAEGALARGEYLHAEKIIEEAIKFAPGNVELRQRHLECFATRAAEQPLSVEALELDPLEYSLDMLDALGESEAVPALRVARGKLLLSRGDLEEARTVLEQGIEAAEDYVFGYLALASLERSAGKPLEALAAFEKAVEADGENLQALNNLGVQYVELERFEDGLAMFKRAIEVKDNLASRLNAGDAMVRLERLGEAVVHLEAAVTLNPMMAEPRMRLGNACLAMKRFDQAAQQAARVLELTPESTEALFLLAVSLHGLGRTEQALKAYQRFLATTPQTATNREQITRARQAAQRLAADM
jgi:tetratricopeptide (TPR) repeat protein